ncbi:TetR/AcrR family transcriptional regulator [Streptomyces xiaopingdaonensis]|uniref:TetR/AcrR family transcriptional regulator n=1 Tax=Streptomyces xiaopingdaonensis TaxID=1565415 RepID=UPI0002F70CB5|nr:TetR/AcrR family transcriptional regulator [Streptomyces xiaopingdaonensis]
MNMRERIMNAAERVIREKGLPKCTTKEIAEEAQCSEGAMYRHFRSKEELFLAVLAERMPGLLPVLRDLPGQLDAGEDVRATLERVTEEALAFYRESIPMTLSVFSEPKLMVSHRSWMQENQVGPHRAVELLAAYLESAKRAGAVGAEVDPDASARLLLGACFLSAYNEELMPTSPPSDRAVQTRALVDQLWRALAAPA